MRIDKYEYGEVRYVDCMDKEYGLPSLEDKSWDLGLTDPPYNMKFKGLCSEKWKKIYYKDEMSAEEYKEWCYLWYKELEKKCNGIIFTPGYKNRQIWFDYNNFEILIWYNNYRQGASKIAKLNKFELILCWGKFNKVFNLSVLPYNSGYNMQFDHINMIHPCPKPNKLYNWIIKQTKSLSIIDPFLGSGTNAEVCEKLGIPWLGYEINEVYSQDIDKRLKNCKKEPKQVGIEVFNR